MKYKVGDIVVCNMKSLTGFTYGKSYVITKKEHTKVHWKQMTKEYIFLINDNNDMSIKRPSSIKRGFVSMDQWRNKVLENL